jgi:hypothetical protein
MATPKSPFLVYENFISPLLCEQLVDNVDVIIPDLDVNGKPTKMIRHDEESETLIYERMQPVYPRLESYYVGFKHRGTERMSFEWYPEGMQAAHPHCESSDYLRKKWLRTRDRDLTGVLFLCDYQEQVPFDTDFEVYGGKLEFPQHNFGFNPQRGTLVIFPSDPHFINGTASINAGDLFQVRIHFASKMPYLYQPSQFLGDYTSWFAGQF